MNIGDLVQITEVLLSPFDSRPAPIKGGVGTIVKGYDYLDCHFIWVTVNNHIFIVEPEKIPESLTNETLIQDLTKRHRIKIKLLI